MIPDKIEVSPDVYRLASPAAREVMVVRSEDRGTYEAGNNLSKSSNSSTVKKTVRDNPEERRVNRLITVAQLTGWLAFHPLPAWTKKGYRTLMQGNPGFPDIVLCRRTETASDVLFIECKSDKGKRSPGQELWGDVLEHSLVEYWLVDSEDVENRLIARLTIPK